MESNSILLRELITKDLSVRSPSMLELPTSVRRTSNPFSKRHEQRFFPTNPLARVTSTLTKSLGNSEMVRRIRSIFYETDWIPSTFRQTSAWALIRYPPAGRDE